jgi:putative ABC transport system substrate-binding protein
MQRRRFLVASVASVLLAPFRASAQHAGKMPRIGYLSPLSATVDVSRREALLQGLRDLGYVEGQNILIEWRFGDGNLERLPELAAELVRRPVDIVVAAGGAQIALAARNATKTIPIVVTNVEDAVKSGLVTSLAHPGGNVTGLTALLRE